ncbi:MAG: glycoside hydrolase family 18 [Rikenellaceae bacterium]|nr:glycoside hydrolase family 18 [Rikenellaceae bacterium]
MTKKIYSIAAAVLSLFLVAGCDTDPEAVTLIGAYEKSDSYYAALREWKEKKDHLLCFAWYAAYAPVEGVSGYKDPASYGERIIGLPDSMDIISLWMGIPSNDPESESYAPTAYADWKYVREKKGTLFVAPTIVRFNRTITLRDGTEYDLTQNRTDEGIRVFAQYLVDQVLDNDLDGLDLDYEPDNSDGRFLTGNNMVKFVQYIAQYFGPQGIYPDKLLIIDFFRDNPPAGTIEYANYFIRQAYGPQGDNGSDAQLDADFQSAGCPIEMYIVTENFGENAATGGEEYTDEFGNTESSYGGRMTSMEGQTRWARRRGAAGYGAFYIDRDYFGDAGPYGWTRRAIAIANQPEDEFNSFYE